MGVKGLATYINSHKDLLVPHELHGGYVVIDGESLAIELYKFSTRPSRGKVRCNCAFGGDYNIYIEHVTEFFDDLEKCGVTPLVVFDGGMEKKKIRTLFGRRQQILRKAFDYTPADQNKQSLLPMNAILAFRTCLAERRTKIVRSLFENDPCIAGVAKILDCPVLSLDTDFYIFGVKYIPLDTLGSVVAKGSGNNIMSCRIFNPGNLSKLFPNIDCSVLPLLAVLTGNDYIDGKNFQNFFDCLGLPNDAQHQHVTKIDAILAWLSGRKLDSAVAAILSTLPATRRQTILDVIELIVNGYLVLPFDMLEPLGLARKYHRIIVIIEALQTRFRFRGNIDNLQPTFFWRNGEIKINSNLSYDETELPFDMQNNLESGSIAFIDTLPPWFKRDYASAKLMSNFVTMMLNRLYVFSIQIEDPEQPCAGLAGLNLIRIIDGLLVAGREEADRDLTYIVRDGSKLVSRQAITVRGINSMDFPALSELRRTSPSLRKRIFDDALELSLKKTNLLADFPSRWRVPVATILYWVNPIDASPPNDVHLYSLLFAMLLGEIHKRRDEVEVNHQPLKNKKSKNKKGKKPASVISDVPKTKNSAAANPRGDSIIEALEAVTTGDCSKAAGFFNFNYKMDCMLLKNPKAFDVTIIHAFSQFQACLKHTIGLNALLGCPYEFPVISEFYNGTMLYNLYMQFEKCVNVEAYIAQVLADAPNLLRLLNLLIAKMKMLIDTPLPNGHRKKRKPEKRKATVKINTKTEEKKNSQSSKEEDDRDENGNYYEECDENIDVTNLESLAKFLPAPKVQKLLDTDYMGVRPGKGFVKRKYKKKKY